MISWVHGEKGVINVVKRKKGGKGCGKRGEKNARVFFFFLNIMVREEARENSLDLEGKGLSVRPCVKRIYNWEASTRNLPEPGV